MNLLIIDSHCLGHIAKHSMKGLTYSNMATDVIYGFFRLLYDLMVLFPDHQPIFCWDSRKRERFKIFPEYKIKRHSPTKTAEEIYIDDVTYKQLGDLRVDILPALGFTNNFIKTGYESDDIMAYIVIHRKNPEDVIASNDEDMFQVLDYCKICSPKDKYVITKEIFEQRFGIPPVKWAEVKAIAGCTSDDVPGVVGVGTKTAIKYLLGNLKVKEKAYQKIMESQQVIERNRLLVTLPLPGEYLVGIESPQVYSKIEFQRTCNKYGFASFLRAPMWNNWMRVLKLEKGG